MGDSADSLDSADSAVVIADFKTGWWGEYDVASLCREFPDRLDELDRRQGDKLGK